LNTAVASESAPKAAPELRRDAEQLSHIILEMQRCFILRLSKTLAPGTSRSRSSSFLRLWINKRC
jgi:hypothetical protein